jgi:hypothetical protein
MRFNGHWLNILSLAGMVFGLSACNGGLLLPPDHLIGEKLRNISAMADEGGVDQTNIAIYDKTVGRVHQFDLAESELVRSFPVRNPAAEHSVLYAQSGNYLIDLTTKSITIFDKFHRSKEDPIVLIGKPISAAFRPSLGFLVLYDDLMSVGVIKLGADGSVIKAAVFGGALGSETISAGDIDELGRLILAMSDGSIQIVDLDATLNSNSWSSTTVNVNVGSALWLAPVRGAPNKVLVQQWNKLVVVDLPDQEVKDGPDVYYRDVLFRGRATDSHVVYRDSKDSTQIRIAFVSGGAVVDKPMSFAPEAVITSRLDLTNDSWTLLGAGSIVYDFWTGKPSFKSVRMRRWRFTDRLATYDEKMPETATFEVNANRAFALFPSKLGFAWNFNLLTQTRRDLVHFNVPFID